MILSHKLIKRILFKINLHDKNLVVLLLTNPHHVDLFRKIIEKLVKNNIKKIIFIIDNRIDKKLIKNFNKKTNFIFHHPTIEISNYLTALTQIKEIIIQKPDALISMSSCQSYERILFDNINCKKILINPHHGDLYHKHFNSKSLKDTKLKNSYLRLVNFLLSIFFIILKNK